VNTLLKSLTLATLLSVSVFANTAEAQQKIGVVNFQLVFQNLPETQMIESTVQAKMKAQNDELRSLETQMTKLGEDFQRDQATLSNREKVEIQRKMEVLEATYKLKGQAFNEDAQRYMQQERNLVLAKIAREAEVVAKAENFDVVLDATTVIYAAEAIDLSDKLISKLKAGN
jgi:outer membrane protein